MLGLGVCVMLAGFWRFAGNNPALRSQTQSQTQLLQIRPRTIQTNLLQAPSSANPAMPPTALGKGPGRRVPDLVPLEALGTLDAAAHAVPLPEAEMGTGRPRAGERVGVWRAPDGSVRSFNPERVLVKFRSVPLTAAMRVEAQQEAEAVDILRRRPDVEFAQLDFLHHRQGQAQSQSALATFQPNDPLLPQQWHHEAIHSATAWALTLGRPTVRIGIVDTPFQMNHPDLAANMDAGWDVVTGQPVNASTGLDHSTLSAGMAAAVVNNGIGVAGAGNCRVLPINITGYTSEMYDAIVWAAGHQVRVVSISWDGADDRSAMYRRQTVLFFRQRPDIHQQ